MNYFVILTEDRSFVFYSKKDAVLNKGELERRWEAGFGTGTFGSMVKEVTEHDGMYPDWEQE